MTENPSFHSSLDEVIEEVYPDALDLAVAETPFDYDAFPDHCPWVEEQILTDYWPEAS